MHFNLLLCIHCLLYRGSVSCYNVKAEHTPFPFKKKKKKRTHTLRTAEIHSEPNRYTHGRIFLPEARGLPIRVLPLAVGLRENGRPPAPDLSARPAPRVQRTRGRGNQKSENAWHRSSAERNLRAGAGLQWLVVRFLSSLPPLRSQG
jgi:hypothetical protein